MDKEVKKVPPADFNDYLKRIEDEEKRKKFESIFSFIRKEFPSLKEKIAWSTPMFTDHGTFIIGFSHTGKHIAVSPERVTLDKYRDEIETSGYFTSQELFRIKWEDEVNYSLLKEMIEYNIVMKKDTVNFWRKPGED